MDIGLVLRLLIVLVLVAGNAFFVATEFALVRVRPSRLQQLAGEGQLAASVALRLIGNMGRVIPGVQLGVTLFSLGLGWIGEETVAALLAPLLEPTLGFWAPTAAHSAGLFLAFLSITFLHVVLGEVAPKNVALARSERLAVQVARPMELFLATTQPFLKILDAAATRVSSLFGARAMPHSHAHSAEELKILLTSGRESGLLPAAQEVMIRRLLDLDEVLVREVMVPRPDIVSVNVNIALPQLLRLVVESRCSRLPVYDGAPEKFIGVLYVKDLLRTWAAAHPAALPLSGTGAAGTLAAPGGPRDFRLRPLLRQILIVPETKPLSELLEEFRKRRRHLALAVDEFGSIAGLVTVEDVLEAVVGEIEDECDFEEHPPLRPTDSTMALDGGLSLLDLENAYGLSLPRDRGFQTLAGFMLWQLGTIPQGGESFTYGPWRFTVLEVDRHRIARVKIERVEQGTPSLVTPVQ